MNGLTPRTSLETGETRRSGDVYEDDRLACCNAIVTFE